MNIKFRASFEKDLKKIDDQKTRDVIASIITEVAQAKSFPEIGSVKKLKGGKHVYRI